MKLSWTGIWNAIAPRSPIGIALGGLAFLASLTPSLIPRTPAMQGIIAAFVFMLAYAIFDRQRPAGTQRGACPR